MPFWLTRTGIPALVLVPAGYSGSGCTVVKKYLHGEGAQAKTY